MASYSRSTELWDRCGSIIVEVIAIPRVYRKNFVCLLFGESGKLTDCLDSPKRRQGRSSPGALRRCTSYSLYINTGEFCILSPAKLLSPDTNHTVVVDRWPVRTNKCRSLKLRLLQKNVCQTGQPIRKSLKSTPWWANCRWRDRSKERCRW